MAKSSNKGPGRRALTEEERAERSKFSIQMPADLEARLIRAAELNARKKNPEIVDRLEQSFSTQNVEMSDFGSPQVFAMCRFLGMMIRNFEVFERDEIWNNPAAHQELKDAVVTVLDAFGPEGGIPEPSIDETAGARRGRSWVTQLRHNKKLPQRTKEERTTSDGEYLPLMQDEYVLPEIWKALGPLAKKLEGSK